MSAQTRATAIAALFAHWEDEAKSIFQEVTKLGHEAAQAGHAVVQVAQEVAPAVELGLAVSGNEPAAAAVAGGVAAATAVDAAVQSPNPTPSVIASAVQAVAQVFGPHKPGP